MFGLWKSSWRRRLLTLAGFLALVAGWGLFLERSVAQIGGVTYTISPGQLGRVEEDWALVLTTPDADIASPQVATQMIRSPNARIFCTFHLNSCDIPTYNQGGLQVQAWDGDTSVAVQTSDNRSTMSTPNELVQWTQYLQSQNGDLIFGIGALDPVSHPTYSTTWGDFSGVFITMPNDGNYLGNYSVDYSVDNSGITFGANRVVCLVLMWVRYYDGNNNLLGEDRTPRIVYSQALDSSGGGAN